ncbi:hypothetical protein PSENEW3_00000440 [Picochlorum sp. SENEW3]|nr:hypothetical protein PSENEW3_00000440 [Picochlorum sp. SENEW3]
MAKLIGIIILALMADVALCTNSTATFLDLVDIRQRVENDIGNSDVEHYLDDPDLYYAQDGVTEGDDSFIWAAESTTPRDVLVSRPVHIWLYVSVYEGLIGSLIAHFDRFVMHYASRGFELERMIFSLVMTNSGVGGTVSEKDRNILIRKVESIGADYQINVVNVDAPALHGFMSSLVGMEHIPLQDWVFMADADELISFKDNDTVVDFIDNCERDGANCAIGASSEAKEMKSKYVAMRGYLRRDAETSRIFENFDDLEEYLKNTRGICEHADDDFCVEEYASYTPYDIWWEFYKSSRVVGNAYLWYPRTSDVPCAIHRASTDTHVDLLNFPIVDKSTMVRILASRDVTQEV